MDLDTKNPHPFYKVYKVELDNGKSTWIEGENLKIYNTIKIPKLYFEQNYVKVNESTINILFGGKNGTSKETKTN